MLPRLLLPCAKSVVVTEAFNPSTVSVAETAQGVGYQMENMPCNTHVAAATAAIRPRETLRDYIEYTC
jgi:hypothetical protein